MKKKQILDVLFRMLIVISTNTIIAFTTVWFLEPAKLYSGGAIGLAQLIQRIIILCGGQFPLGVLIFLVNIPILLVGWKFVSKRFAIYSLVAILVQSLMTTLLESIPVLSTSPVSHLADPIYMAQEINGVVEYTSVMNYGGILTLAIFGGLLAGAASGLALKFGTSTGGIDVAAQALSMKKNISIGNATMVFNVLIACVGGGFIQGDWIVVVFTIVRMIINSLVMDKVHTSYTYTAMYIFSHANKEIASHIQTDLPRGVTYMDVEGGFSHEKTTALYVVVFTHEIDKVTKIINSYDKEAFVTMSPVKKIRGKFLKKSII